MPKSKSRKGHKKKVQQRRNRIENEKKRTMNQFKASMKKWKDQMELEKETQREVAVQVANESNSEEFVTQESNPLQLPDMGFDANEALLGATSNEL